MDMGLKGRKVLVTGGSTGIGRAMVRTFAEEGADIAFTYFSDRSGAEDIAESIRTEGGKAVPVAMNLHDHASVEAAIAQARQGLGQIDVLVNNAVDWDIAFVPSAGENPGLRQWQQALRANLEAPYLATQLVIPEMRARRWGRILVISSDLAEDGVYGSTSYSAAKAGLHGMIRGVCWELGPDNVLINAIMPGLTDTERQLRTLPASVFEDVRLRRPTQLMTNAQDVADAALFFCSQRNRNITGEFVRVTGGK